MEVKIKDRKKEIEFLRMACNMAELGIGYQHADLIIRLQERLKKLKGKFSIDDGVEIHYKWKEDWQKYFNNNPKRKMLLNMFANGCGYDQWRITSTKLSKYDTE